MAIGYCVWSGVESNVLMGTQVFICVKWKVSEPLYQSEDAENDIKTVFSLCFFGALSKNYSGFLFENYILLHLEF